MSASPSSSPALAGRLLAVLLLASGEAFRAYPLTGAALVLGFLPWPAMALPRPVRRAITMAAYAAAVAALWVPVPAPALYAALALAALAIAEPGPLLLLWDGGCGFCARAKRFAGFFDRGGVADWQPFQGGRGDAHGLSRPALAERLHSVAADGRVRAGYDALRVYLLHVPAFWYAVALLYGAAPAARGALLASLLLVLTPLSNLAGEPAYRWVARNRHRLGPAACTLPGPAAPDRREDRGQRT